MNFWTPDLNESNRSEFLSEAVDQLDLDNDEEKNNAKPQLEDKKSA